ncbi:MAG: response regulator [Gemmatimonadota bacterium]|nr:response regulator [Gemmatimonadota bacterium]
MASPLAAEALSCLVVDDEPRLRQAIVRLMQSEGFRTVEAASAKEAVELLDSEPVSLLLTDLRMPGGMDGVDLLRHVRATHPDIAVMMLTAVAEVEVAVDCLAMGAMDYLTKPFVLEEVRVRVGQALEKRRLLIENRDYQERLQEKVEDQARRLEELFLASIQSLVEALELKDPYTRGHSIRVSRYATAIAQTLGLDGEMLRQVELGGHLHDIGKIGVREAVLNKPGKLTADEYKHIMTHPMLGWRILKPLLGDAPIALNIVRWHHERFDGRGIPDGLAGLDIPLEARIVSAADAFDAMLSRRPYRSGLSLAEAIDEIRRNAGSQFEPLVVDAFLKAMGSDLVQRTAEYEMNTLGASERVAV